MTPTIKALSFDLGTKCGVCDSCTEGPERAYTIDLSRAEPYFHVHPAVRRFKVKLDDYVILWRDTLVKLFHARPNVVAWEDVTFCGPGVYATQKWASLRAVLLVTLHDVSPDTLVAPVPAATLRAFITRYVKLAIKTRKVRDLKEASLVAATAACPGRFTLLKESRTHRCVAVYDSDAGQWLDSNAIEAWFLHRYLIEVNL